MEGYENGQPHHAALPSAHSGAFPSPADYASLLHPDPTHTSQVTYSSFPCCRLCRCHDSHVVPPNDFLIESDLEGLHTCTLKNLKVIH